MAELSTTAVVEFLLHRKHCISITKTNQLTTLRKIIAVYFKNQAKHIYVDYLYAKKAGTKN
jgi:hypothetical protein